MSQVKIIKPYVRELRSEHKNSLLGNLLQIGKTRAPGARAFVTIKSDGYGNYLTGMDENARKFQAMDPEVAKDLKEQAKAKRIRLEAALGVDLGPRSDYWKDVLPYSLQDEDNVFDLSDPEKELTFSWLSEINTLISPSLEEIQSSKNYTAEFYIYSPQELVEKDFSKKKRVNEAVKKLDVLGEAELRRIQYMLNLNVPNSSPYSEVYNTVDEYLREPKQYGATDPIENFNKVCSYDAETLNIKYLTKQLIEFRLLKQVGDAILEGNNTIAKSVQDFEIQMKEPEFYYTWEKKLEEKLNIVNVL